MIKFYFIKKNFIFIFILFIFMFSYSSVVSANNNYISKNGINFSSKEYEYISNLYWEGFQEYLTVNDYKMMQELNLFNQDIKSKELNFPIEEIYETNKMRINSTNLTSGGRKLTISKSCSSLCLVTLVAKWNVIPSVYSNDVIGFRIYNSSINLINNVYVTGNNYSKNYSLDSSNFQIKNNGYGCSVKISNVNNLIITASVYVSEGGKIYGSYQHAKSSISLGNSKLYTINSSGYGSVFKFYGLALNKYDGTGGVLISL